MHQRGPPVLIRPSAPQRPRGAEGGAGDISVKADNEGTQAARQSELHASKAHADCSINESGYCLGAEGKRGIKTHKGLAQWLCKE